MARIRQQNIPVCGVLLYTLARPSHQPGGDHLAPVSREWLELLADRVRAVTAWTVRVF